MSSGHDVGVPLVLLLLIVACTVAPTAEPCPDGCDRDGDGWTDRASGGWDCDDTDADRHPGRTEVCNGIDDDCDGAIDDADPALDRTTATIWYPDADRDGYGADGHARVFCARPAGVVPRGGDCDDDDPAVNAGSVEWCNGVDDDCDGAIDDDDPGRVSPPAWYLDLDRDGLGDPDEVSWRCDPLTSHVANASDCDDSNPAVGGPVPWRPDADGDGFGQGPATDPSCDAPDGHAPADAALDCHDHDHDRYPGAPEVCGDGVDQDCDAEDCRPLEGQMSVAQGLPLEGSAVLDWFGTSLAFADATGDGEPDLWVGGAFHSAGLGGLWLFEGPLGASLTRNDAVAAIVGSCELGMLGAAVAGAGDVDGDGRDDVLTADSHGVYLLSADAASPADALAVWPEDAGAHPGTLATGWDVTGDGAVDLVVSRTMADGRRSVWVETLDLRGGLVSGLDGDFRALGADDDPEYGKALVVEDITGDGLGDVLVGMPSDDAGGEWAGGVALLLGPTDLEPPRLVRGGYRDRAGASIATGDVDGDGHADLLVGAPGAGGAGGAWWQPGPAASVRDLPITAVRFDGESDGDSAGETVVMADVDGDGADDLVVSAPTAAGGGTERGVVYVVYGPSPGGGSLGDADAVLHGRVDNDRAGEALLAGADLSADGIDDLVIGARWADPAGDASGAAWVLFGAVP
ncbi:MAG: hypothetical protein ACI8PZ_003293 [Myxococcota bacterium]